MSLVFGASRLLRLSFVRFSSYTPSKAQVANSQSVCSFYESLTSSGSSLSPSDVVVSRGYLLPDAGKAALVDNVLPPPQVQTFLTEFHLTWRDVQYIIITGNDLQKEACELLEYCPNAIILAPALIPFSSAGDRIRAVKDGDTVVVGNSRQLSFLSLPSHLAVHDSLHHNVFSGTAFGLSVSGFFVSLPGVFLPPCVSTEHDEGWPQNYVEYVNKIVNSNCKRVHVHGGGPVVEVKEAAEHLIAGVAMLIDILQTAAWRAREGKSEAEITKWVTKELTQYFVQCGRDNSLSNEQIRKGGALHDWLCHVPVLVKKAFKMAAACRRAPFSPGPLPHPRTQQHTAVPPRASLSASNKLLLKWELFARRFGLPLIFIHNVPPVLIGVAVALALVLTISSL